MADPADRAAHVYGPRSAGRRRNLRQKLNRIAGGSMEQALWELARPSHAPGAALRAAGGRVCAERVACGLPGRLPPLLLGVTAKGMHVPGGRMSVFQTSPLYLCLSRSVGWVVWAFLWRRAGWERQEEVGRVSMWRTGPLVPERGRRRKAEQTV